MKRKFGNRKDGRRLRTLDPMEALSPYIMKTRTTCQNLIMDKFELDAIEHYVREKRRAGLLKFGIMHVMLAAYVRTVSQRPAINRFISGQKVFARNQIEIIMTVKEALQDNSASTVIKTVFDPRDTPADIYEKFCQTLTDAFQDGQNDFDSTAKRLSHIPGLIKKFAFWFLNLLDYFGMIPLSLLRVSPFHGSLCITSMGSLGIQPIYHHLYDFGNVPVFCAFGAKRKENCLAEDGSVVQKKYMDYTFTTDERICDGFYFAESLKLMKRYLLKPELLDTPPLQVYQDID